jgi:hypothetical protein
MYTESCTGSEAKKDRMLKKSYLMRKSVAHTAYVFVSLKF